MAAFNGSNPMGIKFDQLPKNPAWAPFILHTESMFKWQITHKLWSWALRVGRPLTQDETDALAEFWAPACVVEPYLFPPTIAAAAVIERATRHTFMFPFGKPSFDINKFRPLGLDGSRSPREAIKAQGIWASLRYSSWWILIHFTVVKTWFWWQDRKSLEHCDADPRLHTFRNELRHRPLPSPPAQQQHALPAPPFQEAQPTETRAQAPPPQPAQASSSGERDPFVFDDASPVAPQQQQRPGQQYSSQSGSAWDRLRTQARGGATSQAQQGGSQTSAKRGTSYDTSEEEQAAAYARDQAQREFDEMLEKERTGETNNRR